ncbi:glycolate oxidase iron-sulfur subunit [Methylacidimicrobium cyclopophantes]|uniref:Glycolate oxidase iron-sulfur subunit n=1 Tax=Methylacidimicrobium cyclopophantes TaxID=1041766 RepID=A0A5E6MGJ9_9BACT|nr:glycolate oxidase subunit GlcF [Methylacidimicrobium cyclopophantes]VVM05190.1 glycolate oxidase iron-sulfur subunit [Methylacidimicrobium cyclopophantes]
MEARLSQSLLGERAAWEGERLLRACVHCGFCLPACPTYQLLGDELDSPRGRIYLIKEVLEGRGSAIAQEHLDRCLLCRACERECPSGVQYGRLVMVTRPLVSAQSPRSLRDRLARGLIAAVASDPSRLSRAVALARSIRPFLPAPLAAKLPPRPPTPPPLPRHRQHPRRVLVVPGCAQSVLSPATHISLARVCDRLGIEPVFSPGSGCCGALFHHFGSAERALRQIRRNIDLWSPALESGAEALLIPASACSLMVREYPELLENDPAYAERARRIASAVKDPADLLLSEKIDAPFAPPGRAVALHCPCTQRPGVVETLFQRLGIPLSRQPNSPACCGAAGAYALLQPKLSGRLRSLKTAALEAGDPEEIVTANIGCQLHLAGGSRIRVRHWIELVDECQIRSGSRESDAAIRGSLPAQANEENSP